MTAQSAWNLFSRRLVGALLYENKSLFEKTVYGPGLTESDFPRTEPFREVFALVRQMCADSTPVSAADVWTESGRKLDLDWLKQLESEAIVDEREMFAAARRIIGYADRTQKLRAAQSAVESLLDETLDVEETTAIAIRNLSRSRRAEIQDAQIAAIIDRQMSAERIKYPNRGRHTPYTGLCLAKWDELHVLGLEAFTRKYDPYHDIPLVETLPKPVIDLSLTSVSPSGDGEKANVPRDMFGDPVPTNLFGEVIDPSVKRKR